MEGGGDTRHLNTTADEAARPVRSRDGLRSPQCEVAAWICWWRGGGFSGVGAEGRAQSLRAPLAPNTEAPEGWATRVCGEAGGGWRAGAPAWRTRAERPVFSRWPPAWDSQPGCWVGAEVQARERERKNTETALVEVQGGHRSYPHPSASPPPPHPRPSEAKNKNVEKNFCTDSPVGKWGQGWWLFLEPTPHN